MDDLNKRLLQAARDAARAQPTPEEERAEVHAAESATPTGSGELQLEKRQGEWRYYLADQRLRPGMAIELWVDARIGWVRGTFHWGRRNTSVPAIRIPLTHPDRPEEAIGEAEIALPDRAICRWP